MNTVTRSNAANRLRRRAGFARLRRGFFVYEFIVGMGLIAAAALLLFVAITRCGLASSHFARSRAATRAAEAALADLQSGRSPVSSDAKTRADVTPLDPQPSTVKGWQWVKISATIEGQTRTLTGLVPSPLPQTRPAGPGRDTP